MDRVLKADRISNSGSALTRSWLLIGTCLLMTVVTLLLGFKAFGVLTSLIFSSGFLTGFILWFLIPSRTSYDRLRIPFFLSLAFFIVHRLEEKYFGFFDFLASVTGVPTPEILSWEILSLVAISVGSWLMVPFLLKRKNEFGYYLAWTFFSAMGITELAHWLLFPFLLESPFQYIPGMLSVVPLAPIAWIGMMRLFDGRISRISHE